MSGDVRKCQKKVKRFHEMSGAVRRVKEISGHVTRYQGMSAEVEKPYSEIDFFASNWFLELNLELSGYRYYLRYGAGAF